MSLTSLSSTRARTTLIVPHDVERVLANIDADHGDCAVGLLRHGVLLVFAALSSSITGGAGAARTIPLPEVGWSICLHPCSRASAAPAELARAASAAGGTQAART